MENIVPLFSNNWEISCVEIWLRNNCQSRCVDEIMGCGDGFFLPEELVRDLQLQG